MRNEFIPSGDHAIYPDCRLEFIVNMNYVMKNGTYKNIQIESPFISIDKRQIALIGKRLNIDYSKTWSCYKGQKNIVVNVELV